MTNVCSKYFATIFRRPLWRVPPCICLCVMP